MQFNLAGKEVKITPRRILWVILVILIVIIVSTGLYTVKETEEAVIQTFGKYTGTAGPGLHVKLPWPIQTVTVLPVQLTQKIELGYYQDVNGQYHSDEFDSVMITVDMNLVNIDFFVEWKISDPVKYLFASEDPKLILRNLLMSSVRSIVGTKTIDETLTTGKFEIQTEVQDILMRKLEEDDIGVQILDVKVNNSEPPTEEVARAFREVENAKQEKDMMLNKAVEYKNRHVPETKAKADEMVKRAEAQKAARVAEAQGLYDRYQSVYEEYRKFPEISRERMYLEILQATLPQVKVIVDEGGNVLKFMPVDGANVTPDLSTDVSAKEAK